MMLSNLFLLIVWTLVCLSETKAAEINLIIDTDAGADDAVAILLALAVPEKIKVLAITCSYGNTVVDNVEKNVLKTLAIANRYDIPVYSGATRPYIRDYTPTDYFGKDGFGDFNFTKKIGNIDRSKHAALAMIDLVKQHPGETSIVTIGPTSNVAQAVFLDPNFSRNVKRFYVMGSKPYDSLAEEFNFSLDPESNAVLLNSQTRMTKLVTTGHIAADYKIAKHWRTKIFGTLKNERVEFLNKAEAQVLERLNEWQAADSMTLATIIWPELVTRSVEAHMTSDTCSPNPGAVRLSDTDVYRKNVQIIQAFDVEGFKNKLLQHFF